MAVSKISTSISGLKTVAGTIGNDILKVPAGTQLVQGGGGTDTVSLGAYQYFQGYKVVRNADGSINVTDTHGGTLTNTKMVGIATLQFTDGSYNVATGAFTAGAAPVAAPPIVASPPVVVAPPVAAPLKTVTGTTGNDTLKVPAGTQLVQGGGGTDTVSLGAYQYYQGYKIVRNSDGSVNVTDTHGGTLTNTKMTGIATLQFTDGSYNVATGAFTAGAAPVTAPPIVASPPVVVAPPVAAPLKTVTGTAGNDTLTVQAGTQLVQGGGGSDTVSLGAYQYYQGYKIVRNSDGSVNVTDTHGGTLTNTKMTGIATLQFTDGSYNVATGAFTAGAAPVVVAPPPVIIAPPPVVSLKTVTGTTGNDVLTVPVGTQVVQGGGGTDTVSLGAYQYYQGYNIVRNVDGSVNVTDTHGGTLTNTKMVGIATLQFTDGSYNVATGQFTAGAAPVVGIPPIVVPPVTTPGGVTPPPNNGGDGHLTAPAVEAPHLPNDIVAVQIENHSTASLPSRVVTFGQAFAEGDLPSGARLVGTINGQAVQIQVDVKTTHADGSADVTVLSVQAPAIAANGSIDLMLSHGAAGTAGTSLDPHGFVAKGYDASVALTFHNSDGSNILQHIDVGSVLTQALAAGTATTWLQGALTSEVRVSTQINGSLTAQFDIRANADGTFSTDVAILNDRIFSADSKSYTYDISIVSHGQTLLSQANVQQAPMQNWERVVWSSAQGGANAPADHVVYDVAYLQETGVFARYDTSTGVLASEVAAEAAALAASNTNPLGNALVAQYEPMTGARPDIGPTTQWAADWLVTQSQTAAQIMLANASAAASIPIHAMNADGSLVTVVNHPDFWLDSRNSTDLQTVNYGSIISQSGWTPDTAHMPDLTYAAAFTTGSHFVLDQLQAQANYNLLSTSPDYRADNSMLLGLQERGIAWTIRDLANAASLTPDTDPLKAYFTGQLDGIIQNLLATYVHGAAGQAQGELQGYVMGAFDVNQVAPWQQGYLAIALGQAAAQGFAGAAEVLGWMDDFMSGLYLNGANGYHPLDGSAYWLAAGSGDVASGNFHSFTTWKQIFDANFAGQGTPTSLNGYTEDPIGGFSTIAKAALATAWNVTHEADDIAAYAYITQHTSAIIENPTGYASAQTWNITPVLADGHHLQNDEVYYGNGGTTAATTANGLLAAESGNNILQAGSGDSILIGGSGADRLIGGAGNDYLFAGTGAQILDAGPGINYLQGHLNGGTASNQFIFSALDAAHDTVVDFRPSFDTLEITGQGLSALQLLANASANAAGDVVLHLSNLHDVVLQDVHLAQLDIHSLHVT